MTTAWHHTPSAVRSWLGSTHPAPSILVATLTGVFAWSVGLSWWQVGVVFVAMLANQTGIGLGNDWVDWETDSLVGRVDKPIATGQISRSAARKTAIALGFIALALSAVLGFWTLVCQVVMLASGWWYNLRAKRHWSSPLSYLAGFGLLPIFPLLATTPPGFPPWWIIVVAGLLGVSAHFANALPDLIGDKTLGVRGLPQLLGPRLSGVALASGIVTATAITAVAGVTLPLWLRVTTALLAVAGAALAAALAFRPRPPRVIFPLVMSTATVCAMAIVVELAGR